MRFEVSVFGWGIGRATLLLRPGSEGAREGAWLYALRVHPLFRCMGFGTELCRQALVTAQQAGAQHVTLTVRADRAPAIRLYERLGFHVVPEHDPQHAEAERLAALEGKPYLAMRLTLSEWKDSRAQVRGRSVQ